MADQTLIVRLHNEIGNIQTAHNKLLELVLLIDFKPNERFKIALEAIEQIFTDWENDTVKYGFREINEKIEEIVQEALYS